MNNQHANNINPVINRAVAVAVNRITGTTTTGGTVSVDPRLPEVDPPNTTQDGTTGDDIHAFMIGFDALDDDTSVLI